MSHYGSARDWPLRLDVGDRTLEKERKRGRRGGRRRQRENLQKMKCLLKISTLLTPGTIFAIVVTYGSHEAA
jgi:hypothetical protein